MQVSRRCFQPVPFLGTGAIMQPTPRGSGVWVGEQNDIEPAATQSISDISRTGDIIVAGA